MQSAARQHPFRIACRPLQHLHAAHRAPGYGKQRLDAEMIEEHRLGADHVANGDDGKIQAPRHPGRRIDGGWSRGSQATADDVRTNNKVALGVDRPAGPHHRVPPARLAGHRVNVGNVLIARERMADQNRVRTVGIERAVGLIGNLERRQIKACIKPQRRRDTKPHERGMRVLGLARGRSELGYRAYTDVHIRVGHHRPCRSLDARPVNTGAPWCEKSGCGAA